MHPTFTCPASFAQERFWLAQQVDPASVSANLTWTFELAGPLRVESLRSALNGLVSRHEILRTTFTTVAGRPAQVVAGARTLALPVEELAGGPGSAALAWAEEAARVPFDLGRDPPFDARLLRQAADRHYLQLRMHHIGADACSIGLLLDELGSRYGGDAPRGPALQYADFVAWQRDPRREARFEAQLAFWADRLTGAEPPRLPHLPGRAPGTVPVHLPTRLVDDCRRLAARQRVTPYLWFLAAFCTALRLERVRVGTPIADRPDPRLATTVGPFVNTLVLDVDASDDPPFTDLLARLRATWLDAQANKDVPFERVVERLRPDRRPDANPLVDLLFVLHSGGTPRLEMDGLRVRRLETTPPPPPASLVVSLLDDGPAVHGRFDYLADLCPPRSVAGVEADFRAVLAAAADDPTRRLAQLHTQLTVYQPPPRSEPAARVTPAGSGTAEVTREICAIWADVLRVDGVEADDDFFEIGGYSLLAVQILARIEERFGVELTVRQFFENTTPAELGRLL